jgi:hypothetical protein
MSASLEPIFHFPLSTFHFPLSTFHFPLSTFHFPLSIPPALPERGPSSFPPRSIVVGVTQTTDTPSTQGGFVKLGLDLLFTLAIPNLLLGKTFPGMNFGFKDITGSSVTAYVVAALVPVAYILFDLARTRKFNPVTLLAGSSAMIGGVLAFLQVSGAAFALKDSYSSIFLALVMGGSLLIGRPFFQLFFATILMPADDAQRGQLTRVFARPLVRRALVLATLVILLEAITMGSLNFWRNLVTVTDAFGTDTFNEQVATVNVWMRPPSLLTSIASFAFAFFLVQRGVTRAFGEKANLFDETFFEAVQASLQAPRENT